MKKMTWSRFILLLVFFVFGFRIGVTVFASFDDVKVFHPNFGAIEYVRKTGIVTGYDDGTFRPDQTVNRDEFTKIIVGAILGYSPDRDPSGYDIYDAGNLEFSDVVSGEWNVPYIRIAIQEKILNG